MALFFGMAYNGLLEVWVGIGECKFVIIINSINNSFYACRKEYYISILDALIQVFLFWAVSYLVFKTKWEEYKTILQLNRRILVFMKRSFQHFNSIENVFDTPTLHYKNEK